MLVNFVHTVGVSKLQTLFYSHFSENKADRSGGVLYSDYSNVDAINSNFISNKARDGSVMYGESAC